MRYALSLWVLHIGASSTQPCRSRTHVGTLKMYDSCQCTCVQIRTRAHTSIHTRSQISHLMPVGQQSLALPSCPQAPRVTARVLGGFIEVFTSCLRRHAVNSVNSRLYFCSITAPSKYLSCYGLEAHFNGQNLFRGYLRRQ